MTEAEWRSCEDWVVMLKWLLAESYPGDRKLRLFACACCRQVWNMLTDQNSRDAVEIAERFADGEATEAAMAAARDTSWIAAVAAAASTEATHAAARAATWSVGRDVIHAAWTAAWSIWKTQIDLLRDVIGNPFQTVTLSTECNTPDALALALAAYKQRLPDGTLDRTAFPVLADALEEAGCDNTLLLYHLRECQLHVRGCWALDLILGKE